MKKLEIYEIEKIAMDVINDMIMENDYKRGILDGYLRIYGTSKGLAEYLHDEHGENLITFLEDIAMIEEGKDGKYYLLDL